MIRMILMIRWIRRDKWTQKSAEKQSKRVFVRSLLIC